MPTLDALPFLADVKGQINLAWDDVSQILEAEHADRITWTDPQLTLPYAVLLTSDAAPALEYADDGTVWRAHCTAYYVGPIRGKATLFQQKGFDLINQLWPAPGVPVGLRCSQIEQMGVSSWADEVQPDEIFQSANRSQWTVAIPFTVLFGA